MKPSRVPRRVICADFSTSIVTMVFTTTMCVGVGETIQFRVRHLDQNCNLNPTSICRGDVALKDLPKKGDVRTPLGVPRCVMLKALLRFAKTFILGPVPTALEPSRLNSMAFEILKLISKYFGPISLFLTTPSGRSLLTPSPLLSRPVVIV